jgi:hypothetical protein
MKGATTGLSGLGAAALSSLGAAGLSSLIRNSDVLADAALLKASKYLFSTVPAPSKTAPQGRPAGQSRGGTRRAGKRRRRSRRGDEDSVTTVPVSYGTKRGNDTLGLRFGRAQRRTDAGDGVGSLRCTGEDLYYNYVVNNNTDTQAFNGPAGNLGITPNNFAPNRLVHIAQVYAFYAVRRLEVRYVNRVGSSTNGVLALGISENDYMFSGAHPGITNDLAGFADVCSLRPRVVTPCWEPSRLIYTYDGPKVWNTSLFNSGGIDTNQTVQANMFGRFDAAAGSTTTMGYLETRFVVDFYQEIPWTVQSIVAEHRLGSRLLPSAKCRDSAVPHPSASVARADLDGDEKSPEVVVVEVPPVQADLDAAREELDKAYAKTQRLADRLAQCTGVPVTVDHPSTRAAATTLEPPAQRDQAPPPTARRFW